MAFESTLSRHARATANEAVAKPSLEVNTAPTEILPVEIYRPDPAAAQAPHGHMRRFFDAGPTTAAISASRRIKRLTETTQIRTRTTHRRRKFVARSGVLAGFALAMVVYPLMGTVVEYQETIAAVPGVVIGETPTTGHALLGDGPSLVPVVLAVPTDEDQARAIAATQPLYIVSSALPNCTISGTYSTENGMLPDSELCNLWEGVYLRSDAAIAFAEMNEQFKASFGRNLCVGEGYRSYADQVRIKSLRGYLAASPGTSMHGFGLAFDLCSGDDTGSVKRWLDLNAAAFGYVNPDWAKYSKYEPWHWEYAPGVEATGHYGGSSWFDETSDTGAALAELVETLAPEPSATTTDPAATPTPTP